MFHVDAIEVFYKVFLVIEGNMSLFIAKHARLGATKMEIKNVIEFLNSHYPGLESGGQLDNDITF